MQDTSAVPSSWDIMNEDTTATSRTSCHRCRPLPRQLRRRRRRFAVATTTTLAATLTILASWTVTTLAFHVSTNTAVSSSHTASLRRSYDPYRRRNRQLLFNAAGKDEVTVNLERARAVLEKAKQKLASRGGGGVATATMVAERVEEDAASGAAVESSDDDSVLTPQPPPPPPLPFFATRENPVNGQLDSKRRHVIKSIDESTGLITTDGEKMARLSEQEAWEARSLLEVFENEISDKDVYSATSQQLASRDVAASIWNLRKTLQSEDYKKIFDEKNRFIGEGN